MTTVAIGDIHKELARIWDKLEGTNNIRACLFNLIIYTKKCRREDYLHSIAKKVIEQFPCRIIFVSADKDSKEDVLTASVSVMYADKGQSSVACDLIQLDTAGAKQARVPFVILPHIIPDLPVYLVWEEDPTVENPLFAELAQYATRLIFDSETSSELERFAQRVLAIHDKTKIDIADLNWGRLESWRLLFTAQFQSEDNLSKLRSATQIIFNYNAHECESFCHTKIQAIYLQAWLACQLAWTLKEIKQEGKNLLFTYSKNQGEITFVLKPEMQPNLASGIILSVEVSTEAKDCYSFARHKEMPNHIVTKLETPEACTIPGHHIFAKSESGQSLVKEICHKGTSQHYLNTLKFISTMKGLSAC